jgi:hypothetical protein
MARLKDVTNYFVTCYSMFLYHCVINVTNIELSSAFVTFLRHSPFMTTVFSENQATTKTGNRKGKSGEFAVLPD